VPVDGLRRAEPERLRINGGGPEDVLVLAHDGLLALWPRGRRPCVDADRAGTRSRP
jgi:hypothetical protein